MKDTFARTINAFAFLLCLSMTGPSSATIVVHSDSVICTQDPCFHGCNYSPFWDDLQLSVGSREALRRSGVQLIRFPGGWPGDHYNWKDPYAPGDPTSKTSYTQFWAFAKAIGAKCLFQTNWEGNGPRGANTVPVTGSFVGEWVDSCKKFGIDVPLWEIGNEPDNGRVTGQLQWSVMNPYFHVFNQQAAAIQAENSGVKVLGPVSTNSWYWDGLGFPAGVLKMFMDSCGTTTNGVSLHWYIEGGSGLSTADRWNLTRSAAQTWAHLINTIDARAKLKPIYITEWSCLGPAQDDATGTYSQTLALALSNADMIGAFSKTKMAGHCFFGGVHGVENSWGMLCGSNDVDAPETPSPTYFILPLWTKMGPIVLKATSGVDSSTVLSAYAHRKSNNSVQVMLINKQPTSRTDTVVFTGFNPINSTVYRHELKGANNSLDDWDVVYNGQKSPQPSQADLAAPSSAKCTGTTYPAALAPYSCVLLDFQGGEIPVALAPSSHSESMARVTVLAGMSKVQVSLGHEFQNKIPAIAVYDLRGNLVSRLDAGKRASVGTIEWDAREAAAGPYLIDVRSGARHAVFPVSLTSTNR